MARSVRLARAEELGEAVELTRRGFFGAAAAAVAAAAAPKRAYSFLFNNPLATVGFSGVVSLTIQEFKPVGPCVVQVEGFDVNGREVTETYELPGFNVSIPRGYKSQLTVGRK